MKNFNALTQAVYLLNQQQNTMIEEYAATVMNQMLKNNELVYIPIHKLNGEFAFSPRIIEDNGRIFLVIFSDEQFVKKDEQTDVAQININKLVELIEADETIYGISINPFNYGFKVNISRKQIKHIKKLDKYKKSSLKMQ